MGEPPEDTTTSSILPPYLRQHDGLGRIVLEDDLSAPLVVDDLGRERELALADAFVVKAYFDQRERIVNRARPVHRLPETDRPVRRDDNLLAALLERRLSRVAKVVAEVAGRADGASTRKIPQRVEQLLRTFFGEHADQPIPLGLRRPAGDVDLDDRGTSRTRVGDAHRVGDDAFALLSESLDAYLEKNETPAAVKLIPLDGPARSYVPPAGRARPDSFPWQAFAQGVRNTAAFYRAHNRMPSEIWFGVETLSPQDYLATLATVIEELAASGKKPDRVKVVAGAFTTDKYAATDSPKLWNWPIHPENFQAPKIMELARLQAWTLKPAMRQK